MTTPPDDLTGIMAALTDGNPSILAIDGVIGTDIGLDAQGNPIIRIHVPDPDTPPDGLPDPVSGFPTMLVAGQQPTLLAALDINTYTPLRGGSMCSREQDPATLNIRSGTLGGLFYDKSTGQVVGLSNAHVLAGDDPSGSFTAGDPVYQPRQDVNSGPIGKLLRWEMPDTAPLFPGLGGKTFPYGLMGPWDAAVCSIDGRATTADVGQILDIGQVTALGSATLGDAVRKRGIATWLTHGVVKGIGGTFPFGNSSSAGGWWMTGQLTIEPVSPDVDFCGPGDSGSVVVNDNNEVVALLHGQGATEGYATDIIPLALQLNIDLAPPAPAP